MNNTLPNETPLASWKEIAVYLQRDATTARRWEKEEGLPVHRHPHKTRSSVYAYPSEIDAWRVGRRVAVEPAPAIRPWWRPVAMGVTTLLCLVMVGNGIRPTVASAQAGQIARQIPTTGFRGDVDSVSPDGRYLVGTDDSTGDVAIHDLATGTSRHATDDGGPGARGGYSEFQIISPDSRLVAYSWDDGAHQNELRVVPLAGGEDARPQTVYSNPETDYIEPEGWTSDGKRLLVIRTLKDQTIQLGLVTIQDKSIQVLKSLGWSWPDVSLSPDGRYVAYAAPAPGTNSRIVSVLAVDGRQENVLEKKAVDSYAPLWSPDGSRIVFLSDRTGSRSLWTIPVTGGRPAGPPELLKANVGSMSPLGITKNGILYYTLTNDRTNLYVAELDASLKVIQPPALASERFLNSNNRGAWSHDGRYLAYYSFRAAESDWNRSATLVIRNMATGEEHDIDLHLKVPIHSFSAPPRWFPDGQSVLVAAVRPQQSGYGYYRVDLATGKTELLHHTTKLAIAAFQPDLTPDGRTIFYAHDDNGPTELMRFDIENRRGTRLCVADHLVSPAVSPDGTQIAYVQKGSIAIMPVAGGEPRVVYRAPGVTTDQSTVTWLPDQRNLLFVQSSGFGEKDRHVLWRVPLDGSRPQEVGIRRTGGYPFTPQVKPDGRHIAFESHEGAGPEVWTLENFLPKTASK
jgi:Tol biopolymer transport system component